MTSICPKCRSRNPGGTTLCAECGHVRMPERVVLIGDRSGRPLRMHVSTTVGRRLLQGVVGHEARFASESQFRIVKDPSIGWVVAHEPCAANPTYYNGAKVGVETPALEHGSVITVGPDNMRLHVRLEDG